MAWWDERVHTPPNQTVLDAVELKDDVTHTLYGQVLYEVGSATSLGC